MVRSSMQNSISIIAGNPRFAVIDGTLSVDPQQSAFTRALEFASLQRDVVTAVHMIVDHIGRFDERFLDPIQNLTRKNKKHLRLSHVAAEIRAHYETILKAFDYAAEDIHLITEGQCRMAMLERAKNNPRLIGESKGILSYGVNRCREGVCTDVEYDPEKLRVTCTGITAEAFSRAARYGSRVVCFVDYDMVRCPFFVFNNGKKAAHEYLGVDSHIEVRFARCDLSD